MEGVMTPIKIRINESLSLSAIETDKFKTGMVSLSLTVPLKKDAAAANMLLSGVLRRGSVKYPSMALLNRRLDELYAADIEIKNARLGKNNSFIIIAELLNNTFVPDNTDVLDGVLEVISDMILHPLTSGDSFPEESVRKEKQNVCDAIDAEVNNPRAYALNRCAELMHSEDRDFSTVAELRAAAEAADPKELYAHYKRLLDSSELSFFYVGCETPERVAELIEKHFGGFEGRRSEVIPYRAEKFIGLRRRTEPFEASQGKLCLGFRVGVCSGEERYFAAVLFNEIFGGSPASKLFMNVREKMSLCYYCSSSYDSHFGNITVSSGIEVSNYEVAYRAILSQLEDIKNGRISEFEFSAAKKSVINIFRQMNDFPYELFAFYSTRELFGISASPEEYMRRFEEVTLDEVIEVARGAVLDTVYFLEGILGGEEEEDEEE